MVLKIFDIQFSLQIKQKLSRNIQFLHKKPLDTDHFLKMHAFSEPMIINKN